MELKLTKQQYWHLLRAVYMADWMANAICDGDKEEDDDIKNIRNHVFSHAEEMGYGDFVDYDEKLKKYYATLGLDDEPSVRELIERYEAETFWDEIIDRLGERDFLRKYGEIGIEKMDDNERFEKLYECRDEWAEEISRYGIRRLGVRKD